MTKSREIIKSILPEWVKYQYRLLRKYIKKQRLEKQYAGNEVLCLICNHKYRIFEPYKNIENARCTNCFSSQRHRLLYEFLNKETNLLKEGGKRIKLLHFAPEKAFYDIFSKQSNIDYFPSDLNPKTYQFYKKTKIHEVDITKIPFADNSFDVILCNHVLEHIIDDSTAMKELYRVMKPNGWGIFQVPIDFEREETYEDFSKITARERYISFGQIDHVRWYGMDYIKRLRDAGFRVSDIDYTKQYSQEEKFRYGLPEKEFIYFCEKQ